MRRRRTIVGGLALAALAGGVLYRRLAFRPRERAELQFEDGSTMSLAGSPEADELAAHAREALSAALS